MSNGQMETSQKNVKSERWAGMVGTAIDECHDEWTNVTGTIQNIVSNMRNGAFKQSNEFNGDGRNEC